MAKGEVAVLVVGGGAAGIAAARRLSAAGVDALSSRRGRGLAGAPGRSSPTTAFRWISAAAGFIRPSAIPGRRSPLAQGRTVDKTPPPWTRPWVQIGRPSFDGAGFSQALQRFRHAADTLRRG